MTETILKAIMRLFAIVSLLMDETRRDSSRQIVESYLRQLVNADKVRNYMLIYSFYEKEYLERRKKKAKHKDSLFTIKSIIICEQLNNALLQKQKAFFLLQIFDMLRLNGELTECNYDYMKALALGLNFSEPVFKSLFSFILILQMK
ncbi:MAG: hypothetical protein HC906_12555 [Bacteroidales bacterium]|nr:hypothetical protein [Bacteroidales bacterium]